MSTTIKKENCAREGSMKTTADISYVQLTLDLFPVFHVNKSLRYTKECNLERLSNDWWFGSSWLELTVKVELIFTFPCYVTLSC